MSFEEVRVVFTCGICEMICDEYQHHPCLNDYDDVHLDENYYFYPLLGDKKTIIRRAILPDGREGLIEDSIYGNKENCCQNSFKSPPATQKSTKRRNTAALKTIKKKLSDEEIKYLIIEVQNRIPLWNFNIPLAERTREITATLWEEVSAALNGKLSATEAKKKFKSLRDTYRKLINAEHRASGSAAVPPGDPWKFYHCCEFLRDHCLSKDTISNVTRESVVEGCADLDSSVDDSLTEAFEEDLGGSQASGIASNSRKCRRSNKDDAIDSASALSRIADALCRENLPITLPEPPKIDTVGAFLIGLGNQIRQLPQPVQTDLLKQLTDIVYEAVKHNQ